MANIIINRTVNLDGPILSESMGAPLYQEENNAHKFVIQCKRGGNNLTLSGSVQGRMIRADGYTVVITGSVSDGKAVVTLPQSAYAVRGRFAFAVINVDSGATTVIYTAKGNIGYTSTGQSIDPGTVVPDITLLLAQIDAMQQATAAANAAATGALANFAGAFVQATAYPAGTYVTYTDGFMYVLPDGHEADVTWANTTKTKVTAGKELSDLNSAFEQETGCEEINFIDNGYINLTGSTASLTPIPSNSWRYAVVECSSGDAFTISCTGTSNERPYGFIDSENNVIFAQVGGTITKRLVIAPENSAYLIINDNKTGAKSYIGRFIIDLVNDNMYAQKLLNDFAIYNGDNLSDQAIGCHYPILNFTYGVFEGSGYASPSTVNYVYTDIIPAGKYTIHVPTGYRYEAYTYNSDSSGTSLISFRSTDYTVVASSPFVITISKDPIAKITSNNILQLKYSNLLKVVTNDVPPLIQTALYSDHSRFNPKFDDYVFESIFSLPGAYSGRTGKTVPTRERLFQTSKLTGLFSKDTTVLSNNEFRYTPTTNYNLVGISEFMLPIYTEKPENVYNITLTVEKTSGTAWTRVVAGSTLVKGWNYARLYTKDANIVSWDKASIFRVLCSFKSETGAADVYVGDIVAVKPNKGKIIFVDDHGYSNFYQVAYPQLKALGVPVTWAIQPGALGASGGVAGKLTQAQIDEMASDPFCEFSFHSWQSDATSTMTEAQIMADTQKCVTYLKQHGILPSYFWRSAWTQNNAPNAAAAKYILKAYASPSENYGETVYPFSDRFNIVRTQLHGTSDFSSLFSKIQKTHCTVVVYTHDLDDRGGIHITSEEFAAFLTALSAAMNSGYVECTTYSRLCTKYGDNEPYILR